MRTLNASAEVSVRFLVTAAVLFLSVSDGLAQQDVSNGSNGSNSSKTSVTVKQQIQARTPTEGSSGIDTISVFVADPADGVPCFDCVPEAGPNVGLPIPRSTVLAGQEAVIVVFAEVGPNFNGGSPAPCEIYFLMVAGEFFTGGEVETNCNPGSFIATTFRTFIPFVPPVNANLLSIVFSGPLNDFAFSSFSIE